MEHQKVTETTRVEPQKGVHAVTEQAPGTRRSHPVLYLQRMIGNQGVQRLIQAKLQAGQAFSWPEQEESRLANQGLAVGANKGALPLQRKCDCGQHTIAGSECEECRQKREGTVQRSVVNASPPAHSVPPIVHDVLNSPGHSLDVGVREIMEPRFGYDFGEVRVHTDVKAAESAQAVNALAYTVGSDIVFGTGQYAPETKEGERLLAHELTHVVQQKPEIYRSSATLEMTNPEDTSEKEAQLATNIVMQDQPFAPISRGSFKVARQVTSPKSELPPTVFKHNTELGGLIVGNFDFHFRECGIIVWVWLKFQFTKDINATEQADFKERFLNAVHSKWAHSGYSLTGTGNCPCGMIPIEIHAEENTGSYYHKLVDVERKTDVERRPKVISDINVNLYSDDLTLAHEFGHVLGLYDEYDGGFFENIMFWHENPPGGDPAALMSTGTELRPRYFEHYRREVQKTAPKGCQYTISSPVPPGP